MRPFASQARCSMAPMPILASKFVLDDFSATSSTAPIRPLARASPTSGWSLSRAMRSSKRGATERTWPTMLRFS
jgi:hypothetical protein